MKTLINQGFAKEKYDKLTAFCKTLINQGFARDKYDKLTAKYDKSTAKYDKLTAEIRQIDRKNFSDKFQYIQDNIIHL